MTGSTDNLRFSAARPSPESYLELFETTGWNEDYRLRLDEFDAALDAAPVCVSVHAPDGRLIGFGRALSDLTLYAVLFDIIVAPDWRRRGVGSRIVERLLEKLSRAGVRDILLFAAKGTAPFYERFGFARRAEDAPGMLQRRTLNVTD